jgi:hypothetical protein
MVTIFSRQKWRYRQYFLRNISNHLPDFTTNKTFTVLKTSSFIKCSDFSLQRQKCSDTSGVDSLFSRKCDRNENLHLCSTPPFPIRLHGNCLCFSGTGHVYRHTLGSDPRVWQSVLRARLQSLLPACSLQQTRCPASAWLRASHGPRVLHPE